MLVTYDRDTQKIVCDCTINSCLHSKIVGLIVEKNDNLKEKRPEKIVDKNEVSKIEKILKYVLEYKKNPLMLVSIFKNNTLLIFHQLRE